MNQKKILITGANGMLGTELVQTLSELYPVYGAVLKRDPRPNFTECDITNRNVIIKNIERINPSVVIHSAAMTDVEECERDRQKAMQVNFEGTKNVVDGARHVKALLIYISTDFVFSGTKREPYKESHIPHPSTAYGESKLLGEFYVRDQSASFLVIRTSWTYGKHGKNFMTKIIDQIHNTKEIYVVSDQIGSPTYTKDLAVTFRELLQKLDNPSCQKSINSIYHVTNGGAASRFEIACELLKQLGLPDVKVCPVDSNKFKTLAKRPLNSVLDNTRFVSSFGIQMRSWQEALKDYIGELRNEIKAKK